MKKVLITGANSYIGTSFDKYIKENYPDEFQIDTLDMKDPNWKKHDFRGYDSVFHVAGIAHADVGNVSEETKQLYYRVNTELTIETAKEAKNSGVKQFIFMSSIIVYGQSAPLGKRKVISKNTKPEPANFYGNSKLQADLKLQSLNSDSFKVCIIRPPMIYGPGSKGNYQLLSKLAKKLPIFPNIKNERSLLFIGNLCMFIKKCIDEQKEGIHFPQNNDYISTSLLVKYIAKANNKSIYLTRMLNPLIYCISKMPCKLGDLCNKAFGNMIYEKECQINNSYPIYETIKETEVLK